MQERMQILTPETDLSGILRKKAEPVTQFDQALHQLVSGLHQTLDQVKKLLGFGRALAAPQTGISLRIIVVHPGADPITLINPEIIWRSDTMQTVWDDCLSTPDRVVRLQRHQSISLQYQDVTGKTHVWQHLPADLAELLQHEYDHLDGILMIDHATPGHVLPIEQRPEQSAGQNAHRISYADIRASVTHIDPVFLDSKLTHATGLSRLFETQIWLKDETDNPIRCFKGRGAENYLSSLATQARTGNPLVCASAGNWGLALAWSCRKRGYPLEVFVPENANPVKVNQIKSAGAQVTETGHDLDSAKAAAKAYCQQHGYPFAEDGKEIMVTAGAGTIGMELSRSGHHFDAIYIPVGNGALINGVARWIKASSPDTQIIGIVPSGADSMYQSWKQAQVVDRASTDTIADGLAIRAPIPEAVADMAGLIDEMILVSDAQIDTAMTYAAQYESLVSEPSGAAGIAGLIAAKAKGTLRGQVAVIVTGANRA